MSKLILIITALIFTTFSVSSQNEKVLFVMSAGDTLPLNDGEKMRQTGVFLNEFYLAYKALTDAGYAIEFATPNGITATIDQESVNDQYWENRLPVKNDALQFIKNNEAFNHPLTLEKSLENKNEYVGLIIPGGQGLMTDLAYDKNIPILLKHFAEENKPTGLICHAPSLILTIPKADNPYIGFKVNSVSPFEEFYIERFIMKGKPERRKIAKQLRKLGVNYKRGLPKSDHAVKDRNLVTSQNPFSSDSFNPLYLKALTEYLETKKSRHDRIK